MRRRITVLTTVFVLMGTFTAAAEAAGPTAIAVDDTGVSYVGFAQAGPIFRYDADGFQLASWGTPGNNPGQLGGIVAIAVGPAGAGSHAHSGDVWILDTNRRVQEFTRSGTFVQGTQLGPCDPGVSPDPLSRGGIDVTYDSVYVSHPCADQVLKLSRSNLSVQQTATVTAPKGLQAELYDTAPSNMVGVFVAQPTLNRVIELNKSTLATLGTKSIPGSPSDVYVDAFGVLHVADTTNNVIHMYGSDGNEFRTLGHPPGGTDLGSLEDPNAFDVFDQNDGGLNGNLFVADTGNQRIQRWDAGGYTYWGATAIGGGGGGPVNTAHPQIQGNAVAGNTVTCTTGTWTGNPTSYTFFWARDGTPITSPSASNGYTIQNADVGHNLTCTVTATNGSGSSEATSGQVVPTAGGGAPQIVARPAISGTASPGNQLTCSQGTWNNSPTSFSTRWLRDGTSQVGTGSAYNVQAGDVGHTLVCEVTATNGSGSTAATSDPVSVTAGGCADGPHGVTINGGAIFTTSPGVTLTIHEPAGATSVTISNDGGFANSTTTAIACNDSYAWTLPSSGAERLPKVVYVRFGGSGLDPNQTFTDDIILDQTAPTTLAARVVEPLSVLKVRAHDRVSGVASLEVASKRGGKVTKLPYKHSQHLSRRLDVRFVRAIDRAGNYGSWKRVHTRYVH